MSDGVGIERNEKLALSVHDKLQTNVAKEEESSLSIILFYKYHPLSSSHDVMEPYRSAMENLCKSLHLKGRILLGCCETEGINGTLAGWQHNVRAFTYALLGPQYVQQHGDIMTLDEATSQLLQQFWEQSREFSQRAGVPVMTMNSPDDFKFSSTTQHDLFPDLVVKLVKEIIGTGGALASIPLEETAQGYLTPQQWHDEILHLDPDKTVLIDCRNAKECAIGHFPNALDPRTTTFSQFPQWARDHAPQLQEKRVLMYCTGGIRCEKASAYLRRQGVKEVQHLKGGIHKYLEHYGKDGLWKGKNFVFDGRGAARAAETQLGKDGNCNASRGNAMEEETVVGKCLYCSCPYDTFHPHCVCTVCREPTLVCGPCQERVEEYHCVNHFYLRTCYFTNLTRFSNDELKRQLDELEHYLQKIAVGKRYKQKRKTLQKQSLRIRTHLVSAHRGVSTTLPCRNCGHADCTGSCWGFHGLKRKEVLEQQRQHESLEKEDTGRSDSKSTPQRTGRPSSNQRVSKSLQRQRAIEEIEQLQLSLPPSKHLRLGIRVPPPCTRVLQTQVKGKWCGKPVSHVLQEEFAELAKDTVFQPMLEQGLLRLNNEPLTSETAFTKLKNMDVISRIVHWHEPPITTPSVIHVQRVDLPQTVIAEYTIENDAFIYVCDKPSSVPVHPAGPYLSNSLTLMVEAQETLETRSLLPCHRIDRVTSGLTICCTNVQIARIIQSKIDEGTARKLYLARVKGRFPHSEEEAHCLPEATSFAKWSWQETVRCVETNAPIETVDPANGVRVVSTRGKSSRSRFQLVAYDSANDTSLISCAPLTGRGHQLRVHLQWLGYPIDGDLSYGGQAVDCDCMDTAVGRMMEVISKEESSDLTLDTISRKDMIAARSACCCCQNGEAGILSSFTPAQLLYGSAICLHALRYEIPLSRRKRKNVEDNKEPLAVLQLEVDIPKWAVPYKNCCISWLQ